MGPHTAQSRYGESKYFNISSLSAKSTSRSYSPQDSERFVLTSWPRSHRLCQCHDCCATTRSKQGNLGTANLRLSEVYYIKPVYILFLKAQRSSFNHHPQYLRLRCLLLDYHCVFHPFLIRSQNICQIRTASVSVPRPP